MMFNKIKFKLKQWLLSDELRILNDLIIEHNVLRNKINNQENNLVDLNNTFFNYQNNISKDFESLKQFNSKQLINNTNIKSDISHIQDSINVLHNTIKNIVHIGTDINTNPYRSWAVICIEGNMNIVKFVDLNRNDARDVMNFLKQFEAGRHCIDAPYTQMFYDGLFKF